VLKAKKETEEKAKKKASCPALNVFTTETNKIL
jgi:hypothetical protein